LIAEGKTNITEDDIARSLYTAGAPDPDLIVRTAGEMRLSNFLMWQSAYSEFYFTDTLWPDMSPRDVDLAVEEFYKRKRRFGKVL
jgi:undecaprenyl diphosphate synthase